MKIWDFTERELSHLRAVCNFTRAERELFDYRSMEYSLEDCADSMNMSLSTVKRINKKMKAKIFRVLND